MPIDAAALDGFADDFFVAVSLRRVEQAVTAVNGVDNIRFACCRVVDLKRSQADKGHDDAII